MSDSIRKTAGDPAAPERDSPTEVARDEALRSAWPALNDARPDQRALREEAGLLYRAAIVEVAQGLMHRRAARGTHLDDVVQDAWLSTVRFAGEHPEPPRRPRGFLYFRVRDVLGRHLAGSSRTTLGLEDDAIESMKIEIARPSEALEDEELMNLYEDCLARLAERERTAWESRPDGPLDEEVVAAAERATVNAVRVRRCRAAAKLRECLEGKGVFA